MSSRVGFHSSKGLVLCLQVVSVRCVAFRASVLVTSYLSNTLPDVLTGDSL